MAPARAIALFAALALAAALPGCPGATVADDVGTAADAPSVDAAMDADRPRDSGPPIDVGPLADTASDGGSSPTLRVVASIGAARPAIGGGLIVVAGISASRRACASDRSICVIAGFSR